MDVFRKLVSDHIFEKWGSSKSMNLPFDHSYCSFSPETIACGTSAFETDGDMSEIQLKAKGLALCLVNEGKEHARGVDHFDCQMCEDLLDFKDTYYGDNTSSIGAVAYGTLYMTDGRKIDCEMSEGRGDGHRWTNLKCGFQ
jgi:hypothetical protein